MRVLIFSLIVWPFFSIYGFDEIVEEKLRSMTLRQKIGQLFIYGFRGKKVSKRLKRHLKRYQPGGYILFGHNIDTTEQIKNLTTELKTLYEKAPPFIAVDQEGGTVTRIKIQPPFPSALAIGQTQREDLAERIGYLTGEILRALGFNMNLAPVMDLAEPHKRTFIGTRAFGGDAKSVAMMAVSYSKGLMVSGMIPTAKHFPGHGSTEQDSHIVLPRRNESLQQLVSSDLVPFKKFTELPGMSAMMVAHVSYPTVDKSRVPASYSKILMTDLLRNQLNYRGLVITDDFDMRSIDDGKGSYLDKVVLSLKAGADMVMIAWSRKYQRLAARRVYRAVKKGVLSRRLIDEKVRRILKAKEQYLMHAPNYSVQEIDEILNSEFIRDSFFDVLQANLKVQVEQINKLVGPGEIPQLVSGSSVFTRSFSSQFPGRIPTIPIHQSTKIESLTKEWVSGRKTVFYVSGKHAASLANQIPKNLKKETLIVSVTRPFEISRPEEFAGVVNFFSPHPKLGGILAKEIAR